LVNKLPDNIFLHKIYISNKFPTLYPIFWIIKSFFLGKKVIKKYKINIVHQLNPVEKGFSFLFSFFNIPIILGPFVPEWPNQSENNDYNSTFLGEISNFIITNFRNVLFRLELRNSTHLILSTVNSLNTKYRFKYKNKITFLPFGVDQNMFYPVDKKISKFDMLYVGNLVRRKNVHILIEAINLLKSTSLSTLQLNIIGDGYEKDDLIRLVNKLNLTNNINFLGKKCRTEIASFLQDSKILIVPSNGEPFGLVIIEAISCGVPVIFTNNGGLSSSLNYAGVLFFNPGDIFALKNHIISLYSDEVLYNHLKNLNLNISQKFNWDNIIIEYLKIYEKSIINY
jgi:glycosyltransferase involved in cell wall biosynthesis